MTQPALAEPFEDILDGYFTLKESVRQMMARHDLTWAWLVIQHAPVMDIAGLGPLDPVPLHLRDGYAGLIDGLTLTALRDGDNVRLTGAGAWRWLDDRPDLALPSDIRLGEPAYFRGFGLSMSETPNRKAVSAADVLADAEAATALAAPMVSFRA